jgi:cytochrome c oxidase assembly protein subunit 15
MTTRVENARITWRSYRVLVWIAFASLYIIIVTGSLVRLTGSGLGCVDWPACNEERFVDVSSPHAAIEQLNRLFTGVVAASVIAVMLAAFFVRPRNPSVIRLAALLVLGVLGQVVLGGVVVLTGLHPLSNMGHFLLSIVLMTWAYWLVRAVREVTDPTPDNRQPPIVRNSARLVVSLTALAIVTGTVVTGTGPHAGDESSPRFDFAITTVARLHGASVIATLIAAVALGVLIRRSMAGSVTTNAFETFVFLAFLQGGVGYLQYFTGVPIALVAIHVTLSVAVWISALHLVRTVAH